MSKVVFLTRKYGWKKDKVDPRDLVHKFSVSRVQSAVKLVDLRDQCPPVYDQGALSSCTANAIGAAYEFDEMKEKEPHIFTPSRLFIYYNERKIENSIPEDCGAELRNGIKTINRDGVCPESLWDYIPAKFATEPSKEAYENAKHHKCVQYKRVIQDLLQLKQCLIEGFPFVFGMQIYDSFESDEVGKSGIVPMPDTVKETHLGGHAVVCVGFDENKKHFICRNSWGASWGDKGYFYLPYAYMSNQSMVCDMWTLREVDDTEPKHSQPLPPLPPTPQKPLPVPKKK